MQWESDSVGGGEGESFTLIAFYVIWCMLLEVFSTASQWKDYVTQHWGQVYETVIVTRFTTQDDFIHF